MCDKNVIVENKGYRMGCLEHKIEWSESDYRSCPMCMQENDGKERERGALFLKPFSFLFWVGRAIPDRISDFL